MKSKTLYILILVATLAGIFDVLRYVSQPTSEKMMKSDEVTTASRIVSDSKSDVEFEEVATPNSVVSDNESNIEFLSQTGLKLLTDVRSVPLSNGKTFYIGIPLTMPVNEDSYLSKNCGSGGCDYYAYFGDTYIPDKPTHLTQIAGFDAYFLDCETNKIITERGRDYLFGFPRVDKANGVLRVYSPLGAHLGAENVYLIADDGTSKLIASYDNTCYESTKSATTASVIYRDSSYPQEVTAF